ncbi:AimR family lysis-lysogeny pheromone receptor [Halobacillus salinus]|uniref:Uncharacterized protein n=1 Tax=Halobacillus salinus TaxID=192814 RepID=A0A4Z0GWW8_9BACI|nr:AimR family lysis-lysogeny pheromone receptor [Halobacillus salinus]TGB01873.1 hypothetical protein E4663_14650 [Halobacillus salinus]
MSNDQVLKPRAIKSLQMNYQSKVYLYYLAMLREFPKDLALERTSHFCTEMSFEIVEDQVACLEFLYMNNYLAEMKQVIQDSVLDGEVKLIYEIVLNRMDEQLSEHPLLWLKSLHFSHPSLHCLHQFIMVYRYFDIKRYGGLDPYIENCDQALQQVNEPLALYFFEQRYHELLFNHYWKTDNTLLARRYAYKLINKELSQRKMIMIQHHLALTYAFENYHLALDHSYKALDNAEKSGLTHHIVSIKHRTIPFISALHKRTENVSTPDLVETAHLAIANDEYEEAARMLGSLRNRTPFQDCYYGVAIRDKQLVEQARSRFLKENGDHFFAKLPSLYANRI